jgi:hypothetical protein
MKLAKIVVVLEVFGFIEDEHTFNIMNFMKSRLQSQLNIHLNLYTHFFNQHFFILQSFPYDQTITKWQNKIHYYVMCRCSLLLEIVGFFWRIYGLQRKIMLFSK